MFPEDIDRMLQFAETMLELADRRHTLFSKVVWSGEALFHLDGFINRNNSHYWAEQSPKNLLNKSQHRPRLTIWAAITGDGLIGSLETR